MLSAVSSHVSLRSGASMRSFQTLQDDENSSTEAPSLSQRTASTSSPRTMSTASANTSSPSSSSRDSPSRSLLIPSPPPLSRVSGGGSTSSPRTLPPLHTVVLQPDAAPYAQLCFDQQLNTMTALLVGRRCTSLLEQHKQEQHQQQEQEPIEAQNPELAVDTAAPTWSPFAAPNLTWTYSSEEDSSEEESGWSTGSSSLGDDDPSEEEEILPRGIVWLDRHWLFNQDRRSAYDDHRHLLLEDSDDSSDEVGTGENCSNSSSGTTTVDTRCGCLLRRGICINIKRDPRNIAAHYPLSKSNAVDGGQRYAYTSLGG